MVSPFGVVHDLGRGASTLRVTALAEIASKSATWAGRADEVLLLARPRNAGSPQVQHVNHRSGKFADHARTVRKHEEGGKMPGWGHFMNVGFGGRLAEPSALGDG
jgi:hypothetical protein